MQQLRRWLGTWGRIERRGGHVNDWYYIEAGQQVGPLEKADFVRLFASGRLPGTTLVWTESMADWQEARSVAGLLPPAYAPPQPYGGTAARGTGFVPSGPQVRPWVRYWARTSDMFMFAIIFGIFLGLTFPQVMEIGNMALGIIITFVYLFVEPLMLSLFGTTPGKALLNIHLRRVDGGLLTYREALSRMFNVWLRGLGLGIPLVVIVMNIISYTKLTNEGITSWDKAGGFRVSHREVGALRVVGMVALFFVYGMVMTLG